MKKKLYVVHIVVEVPPLKNDFRKGFFPRKFHYKEDAEALVREVEFKDGQAIIKRE